jgi:adenylate cyclase
VTRRQLTRLAVSVGLALACASFVVVGQGLGTLVAVQWLFGDALFKARPEQTHDRVAVVGIDEPSIDALRQHGRVFSWPRTLHAQVITNLKQANARVIAWDLLFDLPAPGDPELAQAMMAAGNVLSPVAGDMLASPAGGILRYDETLRPLQAFLDASAGIGHANQFPDADGSVRSVPLLVELQGRQVVAMPLAAVAHYLRQPEARPGPARPGYVAFLNREIPVDSRMRVRVNYLGPPATTSRATGIPVISYVDVLNGTFPVEAVRDKIVFIGTTAAAYADDYQVPTSHGTKMDGVEIHAHAAATILGPGATGNFLEEMQPSDSTILVFASAILAGLALFAFNPLVGAAVAILETLTYLGAAVYLFDYQQYVVDFVHPATAVALTTLSALVYRVIFEQRGQRALARAFATYVPPAVAAEIARNPDQVKLGGERRAVSVLFTDLKGFTSFSESVEPEVLSRVITQYLNAMTKVVFDSQGTVDKYIGDAVMAFWNAPQDQPDHARRACLTALEMQRTLARLSDDWQQEGLPRQYMRIGVNTGLVSVGNMGSALRMSYTALGDSVNLGARLEPLNNEYGTSICISEFTLAAAGAGLCARYLDLVAVKGKAKPVAVYELIGLDEEVPDTKRQVVGCFLQGIELYRARRFAEATEQFKQALKMDPNDGPSTVYLHRCRDLAGNPPPADWDGVYVMQHK